MPQVLSDPSASGVITNGGQDLFSYPSVSQPSILGLQTDPTQPLPPGTRTAANLLLPDLHVDAQVRNFPAAVFDLAPTSVLTHFLQALLGDAGVGQLRRRQMVARLQQALTSTHFYDLDAFYGALFGAQRGPSGSLPVNPATGQPVSPYTELATPDGWDEIEAIDAQFRERIIALARAISLGATVPGMQAIGEAISGVPCEVYEVWRLVTNPLSPAPGYNTWQQVAAANPSWSSFGASVTWQSVEGAVAFSGLMGNGALNEVVIRPRKTYSSSVADTAQKGADTLGILSVAETLRPASALITVDTGAAGILTEVPVSAAWADSEHWEIVHMVTPASSSDPAYQEALSAYQAGGQLPGATFMQPRPPFGRSQGSQYSYAADVTSVTAQAVSGEDPNAAAVADGQDWQTIIFPSIGRRRSYLPPQAMMPPRKAATARTASPVAVSCAPYSGPRVPVKRAS